MSSVRLALGTCSGTDKSGRAVVSEDSGVPDYPDVFAGGDQASFTLQDGGALPGMASAALREGRTIGRNILLSVQGKAGKSFRYRDKGRMATMGKNAAIAEKGNVRLHGFFAWMIWIGVHIYYSSSVRHRFFVLMQRAWSYFTFGREARIVSKEWRFYPDLPERAEPVDLKVHPGCLYVAEAQLQGKWDDRLQKGRRISGAPFSAALLHS